MRKNLLNFQWKLYEFSKNFIRAKKKASEENSDNPSSDEGNLKKIVKSYSSHPSILRTKQSITIEKSSGLPEAS